MNTIDRVKIISNLQPGETLDPSTGLVWHTSSYWTSIYRRTTGHSHVSTCNYINQIVDETIMHINLDNVIGNELKTYLPGLITGIKMYMATCSNKSYKVEVERSLQPSIDRLQLLYNKINKPVETSFIPKQIELSIPTHLNETLSISESSSAPVIEPKQSIVSSEDIMSVKVINDKSTTCLLTDSIELPPVEFDRSNLVLSPSNAPMVKKTPPLDMSSLAPPVELSQPNSKRVSPVIKQGIVPCNKCGFKLKKYSAELVEKGIIPCPKCKDGFIVNSDKFSPRKPEEPTANVIKSNKLPASYVPPHINPVGYTTEKKVHTTVTTTNTGPMANIMDHNSNELKKRLDAKGISDFNRSIGSRNDFIIMME